ncbi:MAG: DUF3987 domain-containing protein [Prevotella sp.]|nr:DUF3987 domain-containing protein [Prevotella sp.]
MINLIYQKDGKGPKLARPVTTREEYFALRNAPDNAKNFYDARGGDENAKGNQIQFNYNDLLPDGVVKGCKHPSSTFAHDIDCGDAEAVKRLKDEILAMKDEIGLLELSGSARYGLHAVCRRQPGRTVRECQYAISMATRTEYDTNARGLARVMFTGPATEDNLFYLDDAIFEEPLTVEESEKEYKVLKERETKNLEEVPKGAKKANKHYRPWEEKMEDVRCKKEDVSHQTSAIEHQTYPSDYHGIPFTEILKKYWEVNNRGFEPTKGDRDTLTYQLACDLRHICGRSFEWLDQVIPCYDGFPLEEKRAKIKSALSSEFNGFPIRLRNVLNALQMEDVRCQMDDVENVDDECSMVNVQCSMKKLPQGIKESIDAAGPLLAMPVLTAICPCIGALATGVVLDVHGQKKGLNLIAYIVGDFASGKGKIDPVIDAWMGELKALDIMYQKQEDEWRAKFRAAKNKKEQPEEPKLPVRCLTLNNTVANLAERLANTEGKHAFSFTPEADTVAQKWKSAMSDFSVMLRQSYDGTRYEREARSAEAVNVHIEHLLWCVTMCGTPDALFRVVSNYTDGFQSRIAVARTPDNTFAKLEDKPYVLTPRQTERIQQIAHLLPLMQGEIVLPKLEARGREWLEKIRLETMMNDDRVKARQRFRVCVTAQRMTCCVMLCKICESLIQKHGLSGAESQLKQNPNLWKELLLKAQTPQMLDIYDVIADSLIENALYFFRERIENAFRSRDYAGGVSGERLKSGRNDSIFARLDPQFTEDQAMQHSVAIKGAGVTRNSVQQMLKNWRKQGLIERMENNRYRKLK